MAHESAERAEDNARLEELGLLHERYRKALDFMDASRVDEGYQSKVFLFAAKIGKAESLVESIEFVSDTWRDVGTDVMLYVDFAPYSFGWCAPGGLVGGIIYHGPTDGGDGNGSSYSVQLVPSVGWEVHT